MATATTPPVQAPEPESIGSIGRIFGVFFSPKATFESIVRRPTWVLPLLLIMIVSLGAGATLGRRIGWRALIEQQIQRNTMAQQRLEQLKPEQREQIITQQAKFVPLTVYLGTTLGTAIAMVVIAAIFLGVFNLIGGVQMRFSTSLSIVAHAWMPMVITGLLAILILFLKDPATVDPQNIVASNAAIFLGDGAARWRSVLLGSLDLFSFWVMGLLATGYAAVNRKKLSFATAFAVVFCVWLIYVLGRTGIAAAFS